MCQKALQINQNTTSLCLLPEVFCRSLTRSFPEVYPEVFSKFIRSLDRQKRPICLRRQFFCLFLMQNFVKKICLRRQIFVYKICLRRQICSIILSIFFSSRQIFKFVYVDKNLSTVDKDKILSTAVYWVNPNPRPSRTPPTLTLRLTAPPPFPRFPPFLLPPPPPTAPLLPSSRTVRCPHAQTPSPSPLTLDLTLTLLVGPPPRPCCPPFPPFPPFPTPPTLTLRLTVPPPFPRFPSFLLPQPPPATPLLPSSRTVRCPHAQTPSPSPLTSPLPS